MQPLMIKIPGNFWDVQIYSGKLYLWEMNGDLVVYNWEGIIDSFIKVLQLKSPVFFINNHILKTQFHLQ